MQSASLSPSFSMTCLKQGTVRRATCIVVKPPTLPISTSIGLRIYEILIEKRELLRLWWRLEDDAAPIRDAVFATKPCHRLHCLLAQRGRQVCAIPISLLVTRNELRPVP